MTNIGNRVTFLDTITYFQQSLGALANSLTDREKHAISRECEKFIRKDKNLAKKFSSCTKEDQERVLSYLSAGKGTILYEMITRHDSLNIKPEDGNFFLLHHFYSSLKDTTMTDEEYENAKKFYQAMKLENFGELNKINNFQDTIILCEIFEQQKKNTYKKHENITLENVILQVHLVVVSIGTKTNVVLHFLQTLNMSEYLRKH